jgi:hypothetical protein
MSKNFDANQFIIPNMVIGGGPTLNLNSQEWKPPAPSAVTVSQPKIAVVVDPLTKKLQDLKVPDD